MLIGKSLARRSARAFAQHSMANPLFRINILKAMQRLIHREIKAVCSKNSMFSMSLKSFLDSVSLEQFLTTVKAQAPVLSSVLSAALAMGRRRDAPPLPLFACLSVILVKYSQRMSLLQRFVAVLMYAGHAGKQVSILNLYSCILQCLLSICTYPKCMWGAHIYVFLLQ